MSRPESFSRRLSLHILLTASIVFILAIGIVAVSSDWLITREATHSAENLIDATVSDMEKKLQAVEFTVRGNAWNISEQRSNPEGLYRITHEIVSSHPDIVGSSIAFVSGGHQADIHYFAPYSYTDASGRIRSKQLGNAQYDYFFMDWFQIPLLLGEPCWSEPYYDEGGGEQLMATYSLPVRDDTGEIYAILTADISMAWLTQALEDLRPYPHSEVRMVSRNGTFVHIGDEQQLSGETLYSLLSDQMADRKGTQSVADVITRLPKGIIHQYHNNSEGFFIAFGSLDIGWKVFITCGYREVLAGATTMRIIMLLVALLGLLVLFAVCHAIIRRLTQPLEAFTTSTQRIAKGDFDTALPEIGTKDEIGRLRDAFDNMQHSLKSYISELQQTTAANERYASELNIASQIQTAMLPTDFPVSDRVDLYAMLSPAKEVGGDLYDFLIKGDTLYFAVGDVSGKGVPASLYMCITKFAIRFIANMGLQMHQVMTQINNALSDGNERGMFVTLFLGRINLLTGEFKWCNAGHNPLLLLGADGQVNYLETKRNIAAGVFQGFPYEQESLVLQHGQALLLYTDGVTEAERADLTQFGDAALLEWARRELPAGQDAKETCTRLYGCVRDFAGDNPQNDDMTIMTIKFK